MPMLIGHGIDLVDIARIEAMLERHGEQFRRRCFTPLEQAYAEAGKRRRSERYAARFACKEAVMKALGTGWRSGIAWTDIGVVNEPSGRPVLRLSGRVAEIAEEMGVERWLISVSHAGGAGGYAIASAIACGNDPSEALSG